MKNVFYFILKVFLVLKIFNFCPGIFGYAGKQLDKKAKGNLTFNDVTNWARNNYNTRITELLKI